MEQCGQIADFEVQGAGTPYGLTLSCAAHLGEMVTDNVRHVWPYDGRFEEKHET